MKAVVKKRTPKSLSALSRADGPKRLKAQLLLAASSKRAIARGLSADKQKANRQVSGITWGDLPKEPELSLRQ